MGSFGLDGFDQSPLKSYGEAAAENVTMCQPHIMANPETLKNVVTSLVQDEDRRRNVVIFGLPERKKDWTSSSGMVKKRETAFYQIGDDSHSFEEQASRVIMCCGRRYVWSEC